MLLFFWLEQRVFFAALLFRFFAAPQRVFLAFSAKSKMKKTLFRRSAAKIAGKKSIFPASRRKLLKNCLKSMVEAKLLEKNAKIFAALRRKLLKKLLENG